MASRISRELAADIRSDFATRMRSLNKKPKEIAQLNLFLEISLDNINEVARHG